MKSKFKITVPTPCHEDWGKMTPEQRGRFCGSCQKKVFDFTRSSDSEIITTLKSSSDICGRFLSSQIGRELKNPREISPFWTAAAAVAITLIGPKFEVFAQTQPAQTENRESQTSQMIVLGKPLAQPRSISGVVEDATGPIPGAIIRVAGTQNQVETDIDGKFTVDANQGDVITASFIGMEDYTFTVADQKHYRVRLNEGMLLGEVVFTGKAKVSAAKKTRKKKK